MELTPRKQAVLAAIVKAYIETGEPVGSKVLMGLMENAPSSATLRNEMNELCSLGLLSQPHTSAGRVPTSNGYRLYINSLMKPSSLTESTKAYIDRFLSSASCELKSIPCMAADVLSALTGFPAIYSFSVDDDVYLKRAELLPFGKKGMALFVLTSDGRTQSRVFRLTGEVYPDVAERFKEIVDKRLKRMPLKKFDKATLQNVVALSGLNSFDLMPLLTEIFDIAGAASESVIDISGKSELYNLFGEESARRIDLLIKRKEPLLKLFERKSEGTEVIFGNDTGFAELSNKAIVVSKYGNNNGCCGKIGIIGPGRMSYEQIIPSLEYIALKLSELMAQAKCDMEE